MGQGLSVLNFDSQTLDNAQVADLAAGIDQALASWIQLLPNTVSVQVANEMELRQDTTGNLIAVVSGTVPAGRAGALGAVGYAAGVGARVRWNTNGVRNGRTVIGTTFIVPVGSSQYEGNGTLTAAAIGYLQSGADALLGIANTALAPMAVWSKPSAVGASDGDISVVTSAGVPDQASWLTSRRS